MFFLTNKEETIRSNHSGPKWSNDNERVLHIPQSYRITGISPPDCLLWCPGSYLSSDEQSAYSSVPTDWAKLFIEINFILFSFNIVRWFVFSLNFLKTTINEVIVFLRETIHLVHLVGPIPNTGIVPSLYLQRNKARHVGRSKPGSKPVKLYVRFSLRPLGQQAYHVG